MLVRSASLLFAAIAALLLLAATAGCTGGGEPEPTASPAAAGTTSPAPTPTPTGAATISPTVTASPSPPVAVTPARIARATATPRPAGLVNISFGPHTLTEGAYEYSLDPRRSLFFWVPPGLRVRVGVQILSETEPGHPGTYGLLLEDLDSNLWIIYSLLNGGPEQHSNSLATRAVDELSPQRELFRTLVGTVRVGSSVWVDRTGRLSRPPPSTANWWVRAGVVGRRRAAEATALPRDVSGWQFTERWLNAGVYRFALNPDQRPLIFQVPAGLRLAVRFTGPMPGPPGHWCAGLRLVEMRVEPTTVLTLSALCLDIHQAVELSRTIHEKSDTAEYRFNRLVASLRLGPLPSDEALSHCNPVIDASYGYQILTGGKTYLRRLGTGEPPPFVTFDVPARVTLGSVFEAEPDGSRTYGRLHLKEVTSGSRLVINLAKGAEHARELLPVPEPYDVDVGAAFDQILASLRFDGLPSIPGCPTPVVPSLAQTLGAGVYRYHMDPELYSGSAGLPDIILEVPAGLQLKVSLDDELATGFGLRLTHVEAGSWLCLDAELLVECGRSVRPNTAHVGPLFDQIAESLRLGTLR